MIQYNKGFILAINQDISQIIQDKLKAQLFLDEIISYAEFQLRMEDPNYYDFIIQNKIQLMVLVAYPIDTTLFDACLYFKYGIVYSENNKIGPPLQATNIDILRLANLLSY